MVIERFSALKMALISFDNFSNIGALPLMITTELLRRYNLSFCLRCSTDNLVNNLVNRNQQVCVFLPHQNFSL